MSSYAFLIVTSDNNNCDRPPRTISTTTTTQHNGIHHHETRALVPTPAPVEGRNQRWAFTRLRPGVYLGPTDTVLRKKQWCMP